MSDKLLKVFHEAGISARAKEPFCQHLPLRTEGQALAWVRVKNINELKLALRCCRKNKKSWKTHWPMESWLTKGDWRRVIIRLSGEFSLISYQNEQLHIGTAALWGELSAYPQWGQDFQHWPSSVGALFQNQQQYLLKGYGGRLQYYHGRTIHQIDWTASQDPTAIPERAIPLKLILEPGRRRRRKNPPAAGAVFRCKSLNLADAFQVSGLLGTRLYGWQLTEMAPGHIVHTRKNNSAQFLLLYKGLKERLKVLKNIDLELQIPMYGGGRRDK